jgi:hypothetical protein
MHSDFEKLMAKVMLMEIGMQKEIEMHSRTHSETDFSMQRPKEIDLQKVKLTRSDFGKLMAKVMLMEIGTQKEIEMHSRTHSDFGWRTRSHLDFEMQREKYLHLVTEMHLG